MRKKTLKMIRLFVKINSSITVGLKYFWNHILFHKNFDELQKFISPLHCAQNFVKSIKVLHEWIFIPNFFHIKARKFEARHFLFLFNFTFLSIFTSYVVFSRYLWLLRSLKITWPVINLSALICGKFICKKKPFTRFNLQSECCNFN